MFSADNDTENPFASGTGGGSSSYPPRQDRGLIEKKLIVRRLVQIVDCDEEAGDSAPTEELKKEAVKKHLRRYPHRIWVATENKFMKFSEPLVKEETNKGEDGDDDDKKKKKKSSRRREEADEDNGEDENSIASDYVPHYQRLSVPELSNRNLQETDVPEMEPAQRSSSNLAEIALGDGTLSPNASESEWEEEDEDESDSEFDEETAASVHASIGEQGAEEEPVEAPVEETESQPVDNSNEDEDNVATPIQICVECGSDDDGDVKVTEKKKKIVEARESMAASSTPSQQLEADYFGIE
ncbi:MAG: hypothetical protein SGILL_002812, partial [Bacillariaceae sp.]